jgi:hypothetical protein
VEGTNSNGLVLTSRLTPTVTLELDALGAVISISPVHCPAVRPVVLICTLSVLGVAPCVGVTTSQLFPQLEVLAAALKLRFDPVLLVRVSVCGAGAAVPIWNAAESWAGFTLRAGVPAMVTRTGTLIPVVPGALIATAPLKMPAPPSAAGFTVTWNELGRPPEAGKTDSQFPPPFVIAVAVKAFTDTLLLDAVTVCDAGTVLFAAKLKLSELGLAVSGLLAPDEFTFSVTGTVTEDGPGPRTLMNPVSVPEVGAPAPMETVSVSGVAPELGVATSQLLVENVDTVTLTGLTDDVIKTD